ncbi:aldose 1-epimerase family protein [Leifsonia shinshuensis]|uniref:aldose 1-epimerase family protein n=1 Tax=Leifsonia shinshuensis TaxID=150026 RepID=UPI001F507E32|nr:aldose 1-epimerase family protein [Leifsonia shinshuensis]MCI0157519.1 aldose 1-epimerase family protein [Leifsonia shinshuensis]
MTIPLSGTHYGLTAGDYHATIASVGASLRTLEHRGRRLVVPFDADDVRPVFRGATLAPWPNRVVDGRYTFDGATQQLALTEPGRGHALHGLAAWLDFTAVDRSASSVTLAATIEAQDGYPHRVEVAVAFELDEDGLHTTVTGTNSGPSPAPWGTGPHPYLVAGDGRVDDWTLELPASDVLTVTEDRLIPIGLADVAVEGGGVFDFRAPRAIADTFIDHAFTGLLPAADGRTTVALRSAEGTGVAMTWDEACPWVQIHTADRDVPEQSRLGLAVEPMTCPPDAYNSGTDLIVLAPGQSTTASWTIAAL